MFTASASGVVVYTDGADRSRVAWFDRDGRETRELRPPDAYLSLRISRDGREVLFDRVTRRTRDYDLWSLDLAIYLAPDNRVMSVPLGTGASPQLGAPAPMFTLPKDVTWSA